MASENWGRDNTLPDSAALWNGSEGFAFPLLHSEASHSGIRDSDSLSFFQMQVSPPPMGNFHGDPATNYVGHAFSDSLSSMMSNVTQDNAVPSFSALNGRQSYDLRNVQLQEVPPGICSILQLDNNRSPINIGGERGNFRHGPDNSVMPGAPQFDSSILDGSFSSLGHRGSAGSRLESYASARDYNVNSLSLFPFGQEIHHGPFNPIDDGVRGSYSQKLVPSGHIGCLTLSNNNNGTLPGLTSGFNVSPSLPSQGQLIGVSQFMPAANGRSPPVMGNDMNSRYTDPDSKVYRIIPSGVYANSQYGCSESGYSWMSILPSEAVTTRIRQQSIAEDSQGINLASNVVFPFQSRTYFPTLGTSSRMDQLNLDLASQERIMNSPTSESINVRPIASDQAVTASNRSKLINDSNAVCINPLKRGPSSVLNVTPRKLMRQQTVGPSHLHVNPAQPQNSVLKITSVNPSTPPAFTNIPQQQLHSSFPSPIKTTPLQNTLGGTVPAFTPFTNNRSSIDLHPNTVSPPQQCFISNSTNAYPNSSPAFTNITQPPHHPSLVPQAQTTHLQKASPSMEHPFYCPSALSPMQNPLWRLTPGFGAPSKASCSSSTYFPKAVPQPSIGATGNSFPSCNHTALGSLSNSAKKPPTVPVASTKTASSTARDKVGATYSSVVQRFIERQTHALAAFERKLPPHAPSVTTSSTPHIKWQQGLEKREASGLKCLLCKRDLVYTPEGPVSIPAFLPEVAVLSCGHVFHDHCLRGITPQDQRADPPCIPCSIGEPCA